MAINSTKFFDSVKQDVTVSGTLFGRTLSKEERIEAHKTKDPIKFKSFVEKVLNRKGGDGGTINGKTPLAPSPNQKALPGTAEQSLGDRMAAAFDSRLEDVLKSIREDVGGILAVIEKQTEVEEDAAAEEKQEAGKKRRGDREKDRESKTKPNTKAIPSLLGSITKPMKNLWDSIVKTFGILLTGWGINTLLKWWGDPANEANVKAFTEFITKTLPVVIKGILALVALDIGFKIAGFVKIIAMGSLKLLLGLKALFAKTMAALAANPWLAAALGVAALGVGIGMMQRKGEERLGEVTGDTGFTANTFGSGLGVPVVPNADQKREQTDSINPANPFEGMFNKNKRKDEAMDTFNQGGFVSGPEGVDRVPAKLTAGEFVMSKGAVNEWGLGTLMNMNAAGGGTNEPTGGKYEGGGKVERTNQGGGLLGRTGKAGYLGDDRKVNRFPGPKNEAYFLQIQKKTGEIEIWNEEWGSDKYIGAMDPNTKNIQFNQAMWGGARPFEVNFFSQQKNKQMVMGQAHKLIKQAGASKEITDKKASELINNPPGRHGSGKTSVVSTDTGGGGVQGGGGDNEVPSEPMFSPRDKSNHYTLLVASMCNIMGEN